MISWSLVLERLNMGNYDNYYDNLKDILEFLYCEMKISLRQIAELTNGECSACSLGTKMKELGIGLRSKGGANYAKPFKILKEEYKELTYKEMALRHHVHITTVRNRCKKYIEEGGKKRKPTCKSS